MGRGFVPFVLTGDFGTTLVTLFFALLGDLVLWGDPSAELELVAELLVPFLLEGAGIGDVSKSELELLAYATELVGSFCLAGGGEVSKMPVHVLVGSCDPACMHMCVNVCV